MKYYHCSLIATYLLLFSGTVLADCAKEASKFESCGASTAFGYTYELICNKGNELTQADIAAILKSHEHELEHNVCLQRVYREPRVKRNSDRQMHETRKELEPIMRAEEKALLERHKLVEKSLRNGRKK